MGRGGDGEGQGGGGAGRGGEGREGGEGRGWRGGKDVPNVRSKIRRSHSLKVYVYMLTNTHTVTWPT